MKKILLSLMLMLPLVACSSTAEAKPKSGPPPTQIQVVSGWTNFGSPYSSPIQVEVVKINGYCVIAAHSDARDAISLSVVPNSSNGGAQGGCP